MHSWLFRFTFAALVALSGAVYATPSVAAVHLSLFHPWSTNPDPDASASVAVSLIQSRIGTLRGVGLHPIVSQVGGSKGGLDVVGIFSSTGGAWTGFSATGGISVVRGPARGVQLTGIANFDESTFHGIQFAGLLNNARGGVRGIQYATFVNASGGPTRFLQLSAVANIAEGPMHGVQVAGINFGADEVRGVQVGLGNLATRLSGAQAGLLNFAGEAHGLQLGAINVSGTNAGVPVGLFNRAVRNGMLEAVAFASSFSAANAGVRTTVNRFQSTLSVGGIDLEGDVSTAGFVTWNYGYRFPLADRFELGADVGFTHVIPEKSDDPADRDRLHYALLARALPEYRVSPRMSVFAGVGMATIFDEYSSHAASETVALFTAGLAVTP